MKTIFCDKAGLKISVTTSYVKPTRQQSVTLSYSDKHSRNPNEERRLFQQTFTAHELEDLIFALSEALKYQKMSERPESLSTV